MTTSYSNFSTVKRGKQMKSDLQLVETSKEQIQHKVNTSLRVFVNRLHSDFPAHWHPDIEIIHPLAAPYKVVCSTHTYVVDVGDIIIICPAVIHEIFSLSNGARLYIQADFSNNVSLSELNKAFRLMSPALHIQKKHCPEEVYKKICKYIEDIKTMYFGSFAHMEARDDTSIDYIELEPFKELDIYSMLIQLISFCAQNYSLFVGSENPSGSVLSKNTIVMSNVCAYIAENFTENITLEEVASYAGFSKYHFERIFTDYSGMTFYKYLQQMRVNYAQTLLSNSELSITDVSYQSGFASSAAFTRAFKKGTGYAPSQFRTLQQKLHPHPDPLLHQD